MTTVAVIALIAALLLGAKSGVGRHSRVPKAAGWLYFIADSKGPVLVAVTQADGIELPDSAHQLRVVYQKRVGNVFVAMDCAQSALGAHRVRGNWFDRDSTLFYIEHVKEAV